MVRHKLGKEAATIRGPHPRIENPEIFEHERHTGERPLRESSGDSRSGLVVHLGDNRIDGRIAHLDAVNHRLK